VHRLGRRRHGPAGIDKPRKPTLLAASPSNRTAPISTTRSVSAKRPVVSRSNDTNSIGPPAPHMVVPSKTEELRVKPKLRPTRSAR
jgi:hypothetical protein